MALLAGHTLRKEICMIESLKNLIRIIAGIVSSLLSDLFDGISNGIQNGDIGEVAKSVVFGVVTFL